jgi:hypothetical protein
MKFRGAKQLSEDPEINRQMENMIHLITLMTGLATHPSYDDFYSGIRTLDSFEWPCVLDLIERCFKEKDAGEHRVETPSNFSRAEKKTKTRTIEKKSTNRKQGASECYRCGKTGHKKSECPVGDSH